MSGFIHHSPLTIRYSLFAIIARTGKLPARSSVEHRVNRRIVIAVSVRPRREQQRGARFGLSRVTAIARRLAMPTDVEAPKSRQVCERCGAVAIFAAFIPRFGDRPAYSIFDCAACSALTWIAEKISE